MSVGGVGGTTLSVSYQYLQQLESQGKELDFGGNAEAAAQYLNLVNNAKAEAAKATGLFNPILEIPMPVNAEELGLIDEHLNNSLEYAEITITQLFELMHEMGVEMRKAGKEARQATREAEQAEMQAAADKIRSAAFMSFVGAMVSGAMQIAGGLTSIAGAAASIKSVSGVKPAASLDGPDAINPGDLNKTTYTGKPGSKPADLPDAPDAQPTGRARSNAISEGSDKPTAAEVQAKIAAKLDNPVYKDFQTRLQNATTFANFKMDLFRGMSQILGGIGTMVQGSQEMQAKGQEAERTEAEADAKKLGYLVQDESETLNSLKEMLGELRQKLQEIQQAQSQVESKIWS